MFIFPDFLARLYLVTYEALICNITKFRTLDANERLRKNSFLRFSRFDKTWTYLVLSEDGRIIKHLSRFLPLKALDQMYKTLVRPHLDSCDIIYHIPPLNSPSTSGITLSLLVEKVERTQHQAALAITGSWQGSSRTKLYEELGWSRRILQIHKIRIILLLFTSKKNYQHFVHPCIELLIKITFTK